MTDHQVALFLIMLLIILVQAYRIYKLEKNFMTFDEYLARSMIEAQKAMDDYDKVEIIEVDFNG